MATEALSLDKMGISGAQIAMDLKPAVRVRVGMMRRLRRWAMHLIEESDWDEQILKTRNKIDLVCWAAVLAIMLCLLPVLIRILS